VLPAAATTPAADGFGKLESQVAVSPLTGARLSQLPNADGTRSRHVTPIVKLESRLVRKYRVLDDGAWGKRIVSGSFLAAGETGFPA